MRKMSMRPGECSRVRRSLCCFGHRHIGTSVFRTDVILCGTVWWAWYYPCGGRSERQGAGLGALDALQTVP